MKSNPYHIYLKKYFHRLLELRHIAHEVDSILKKVASEYKPLSKKGFHSLSSLVISDWTGSTDNGWTINYGTGIHVGTSSKNYKKEIDKIISTKCTYLFAQSFEALETFLKDCVFTKSHIEKVYRSKLSAECKEAVNRSSIPGGEKLFKLIKRACGNTLMQYSRKNNKNIRFKEFWKFLSFTRHSITHSSSKLSLVLVKEKYYFALLKHFFQYKIIDTESVIITLDYYHLAMLLDYEAEFGFQIFKALSETDNLNWHILK